MKNTSFKGEGKKNGTSIRGLITLFEAASCNLVGFKTFSGF